MRNLEGIKIFEIPESEIEKKSILVNDDNYTFDDCALTELERLKQIKEALIKVQGASEIDDNYEDCRKK